VRAYIPYDQRATAIKMRDKSRVPRKVRENQYLIISVLRLTNSPTPATKEAS